MSRDLLRRAVVGVFLVVGVLGCEGETPSLEDLLAGSSLQVETPADGTLTGTVGLDGFGNCEGISIEVSGPDYTTTTTTKAGGNFELGNLGAGAYQFTFSAPDFDALEELVVYETREPMDVGTFTLSPETVPILGNVSLSDGENPAGSVVSVSGETEMQVPDGVVCTSDEDSFSDVFDSTVLTDGSGRYETRVPRSARAARARAERGDYTSGEVEIPSDDLADADDDNPVELGELILYPLTGFVNIVGGKIQPSATITLQISAFNAGEVAIAEVPEGDACDDYGDYQSFDAELDYTVADGDGEYTICVKARNAAGDEVAFARDVLIDSTPPDNLSLIVGSGGTYTKNAQVNIQLFAEESGSGLSQAWIYVNGTLQRSGSYSPSLVVGLGTDGSKTVTAIVSDRAGHLSAMAAAAITVDTAKPTYTTGIISNTGRTVSITYTDLSDASALELRVGYDGPGSTDLPLASAAWQAIPNATPVTTTFVLPSQDGTYQVFAQLRDAAGNVSDTALQNTLFVDEQAPENLAFSIQEAAVSSPTITLDVAATDLSPTLTVQISETGNFGSPDDEFNYGGGTQSYGYTLENTEDGFHVVQVRFCDDAGNCTDALSDSVILDTTPPGSPAVANRSGIFSTSTNLTLDLFASGADEMAVQVDDSDFSGASWASYAPEKIVPISGDGEKTIWVMYRDFAGWTTGPVSTTVTLDQSAPTTPTVLLNGGNATNDRQIQVALSGYTPEPDLQMRIAENPSFSGAVWQDAASVFTYTLSSADGSKTVYVQLRDPAGNTSGTGDDTIDLDTTPPTGATLSIVGSPSAVSQTEVDLTLSATDADTVELADNLAFTGGVTFAYTTATSTTLTGADGTKNIYARYCDEAGNCTGAVGTSVVLDTVAPLAALAINGGATFSLSRNVTLTVTASDNGSGVAGMHLQNDSETDIESTSLLSFEPTRSWTLSGSSAETASKTVYLEVIDQAGNRSVVASDDIVLDNEIPTPGVPALEVNGGDALTKDPVIDVALFATGADEYQLSQSSGFGGASWQPMTDTASLLLSGGDGLKTVYVRYRDDAGNTSGSDNAQITLDREGPSGISVSGPDATSAATVSLTLTGSDTNGVEMRLSEEADFSDTTWGAFAASTDVTLSAGDGDKTIYVQFRDGAGNTSQVLVHGVEKDTTAPDDLSIAISETPYSQTQNITVLLSAAGADDVRLSENEDFSGADWSSFGLSKTFALSAAEGEHAVWAQFRDAAGNLSAKVSTTTILDLTDPDAPGVTLNATDAKTSERTVDVSLTFTSGDEEEMQLSESSGFGGASWVSVTDETSFQLSTGEGSKTLFVRVRDASGRMSGSGQDSIIVDTSAPGLPTISLDSGASQTSDLNIDVALGNLGDATEMILGNDASFSGKSWEAATPNTVYTLPAGDGVKTVYVKTRDDVGNESSVNSASIILDTDAPGSPQLSIDGGATYTQDADVVLSLFSSDADEMRISEASDFSSGTGWIAYSSSYSYTILGGQGDVTIYAEFRDDASNTAGPVSAEIHYDGNPPSSGSGIAINNNDTYTTSRSVELTLDIPGDATEIIVANNVGFAGVSWQSATATIDWDLTSSDGSKIVYAKWRDVAGNETGIQSSSIELDTEAPTPGSPAILLDGGKQFSSAAVSIPVMLSASDGPYWMELSDSQSFDSPLQSTYYTETTWVSVPATDGTTTIYVRFQDQAGNWSESRSDSIDLDRTAPTLSGLTANQGNAYTRFPDIELQLSAYDDNPLVEIEISEDDFGSSEMRPFQPQLMYMLQAAEGVSVDVSVRIRDAAGNWSSPQTSQSITLDQTAPIPGSPAILINGGALRTNQASSTLTINSGDADEMRLANNPGFTGGFWQPVTDEQGWILSGADGDKKVFVQFRDEAGNTTPHFSAEITLDTTPPLGAGISIAEMPVTSATTWTVNIAAGDANVIYLSEESDFGSSVQFGPMPNTEYVLTDTSNGNRTLYAKFCDLTGNCTGNIQQNRTLDTEAPYISSLRINNGAGKTADMNGNVTLNLFAGDTTGGSGIVGVRLGNSLAQAQSAPPQPYEQTKVWTLGPPTGNGVDQSKTVWAIYHDAANNQGPVTSATIRYDRVPPAGTISFDAAVTNDSLAGVTLTYDPDTAEMKLSYGQTCAGGSWASVTSEALWPLSLVNGAQYISVRYRDDVGNEGNCFNDSINLDTIGPAPNSFSVAGNAGALPGYSNEVTLTANASAAADPTGCNYAEIAEDVSFLNPVQTANCGDFPYDYELANQNDGTKSIYLRFYDNLGNAGAITQQTITLDRSVPTFGISGGFTIAQGDFTNTANITLQLDASGATRVRYGQGAGCGFAPVAYSTTKNLTLTGGNGQKTVSLRYLDDAGNQSACFARSITLDTFIAGFTVSLQGHDGNGGTTASQAVTVTLGGVNTADAIEMKVSNLASFTGASWEPLQTSFDWFLPSGDGTKNVFVAIRDAAGNSADNSGSIVLDQTPPNAPALQVIDIDGDGFALTDKQVELSWTDIAASDSSVAAYQLQRFIHSVDGDFKPITTVAPSEITYADNVASSAGNKHNYRVRTVDNLGQASEWSIVAQAFPYRPVTQVSTLGSWAADTKLSFSPHAGTFNLTTIYAYTTLDREEVRDMLEDNQTVFTRSRSAEFVFDESLIVRTANQDNSLVFETEIPFNQNIREFPTNEVYVGNQPSIVLNNENNPFISHYDNADNDLVLTYRSDGDWYSETITAAGDVGQFSSLVLDDIETIHVAYFDESNDDLIHAFGVPGGSWQFEGIDSAGDVGAGSSLEVDASEDLHVSYIDRGTKELKYATNNSGSWVPQVVDSSIDVAGRTSVAVDQLEKVHIAYKDETNGNLKYATNASGSWVAVTVATAGDLTDGIALEVDRDGHAHIAYLTASGGARFATNRTGSWVLSTIDSTAYTSGIIGLALDDQGRAHVSYGSGGTTVFRYATNVIGTWEVFDVDNTGAAGRHSAITVGAGNRIYLSYVNRYDEQMLYAELAPVHSGVAVDTAPSGFTNSWIELAMFNNTEAHLAYYQGNFGFADNSIRYATNVGGVWQSEFVKKGVFGDGASDNSVTIDTSGNIHVAYHDPFGSGLKYAHNITGIWDEATVASGNNEYTSIGVDVAGDIHISSYSSGNLRYSTNSSGSWTNTFIDSDGNVGPDSDLVIDGAGNVHISYYDVTNGDLKYANNTTGTWAIERIETAGNVGHYTSIDIDSQGYVHISYHDFFAEDLKYITNKSGAWVSEKVETFNTVGGSTSIDIDKNDRVHIVYDDATDLDIKYATKQDNGTWETVVFGPKSNGAFSYNNTIIISADGMAHIAYGLGSSVMYFEGLRRTLSASSVELVTPF